MSESTNNKTPIIYSPPHRTKYLDEEFELRSRAETIGKILKFLRKESGLLQKDVAQRIGIAQQTYAGYESGRHEPSIELMIRLANMYRVTLDYITGRNIEPMQEHEEWKWLENTLPQIQRQFESEKAFTQMAIRQA